MIKSYLIFQVSVFCVFILYLYQVATESSVTDVSIYSSPAANNTRNIFI